MMEKKGVRGVKISDTKASETRGVSAHSWREESQQKAGGRPQRGNQESRGGKRVGRGRVLLGGGIPRGEG